MGRRRRASSSPAVAAPAAPAAPAVPAVPAVRAVAAVPPPPTAAAARPAATVKIAGYVAVRLPGGPSSARWVYLRPHAPGVLFMANLPSTADVMSVRRAVPSAGPDPDDVVVQLLPGGGGGARFARVRLRGGVEDVAAALAAPADWLALECLEERAGGDECPAEGWLRAYWAARDADAVAKWSAATMDTFERCERAREEREKAEAEKAALPDEAGFVVVRRGASAVDGANGVSAAAFNAAAMERRAAIKKKRDKGVERGVAPDGFYRWQRRQGRKQELDELRKRFEDDKKRVAAIRSLD